MKIAFDGQLFLKGNKTGIAWCAHNLIEELNKIEGNECTINCFTFHYPEERLKQMEPYEKAGCKIQKCTWFHDVLYKLLWSILPVPYGIFFKEKPDITQFFNFVIPPGVKGKKVTIIHDMAYKACPETVRKKTRYWLELNLARSCKRADKIITVSEFSKKEIIKYLGVAEDKIAVVPNGVNQEIYHNRYTETEVEQVKKKYNIEGPYFLFLGTLEPRKNIEGMIKAYAELYHRTEAAKRADLPKLVLAGGKGWMYDTIFQKVRELSLEKQVIFTGYIESPEAPVLMKGATAFVFVSFYEGFGMPPLEAMACGTPVISANCTSLPEVIGDAGILADPYSVTEMSQAMEKIWLNEEMREELRQKGMERAQTYTWEKSARMLEEVYRELGG